jgi:hypothetical protein
MNSQVQNLCADRYATTWHESDAWSSGCQELNYANAKAFCESQGGRLPTLEEVEDGCVAHDGCGFNIVQIWTSTGAFIGGQQGADVCPTGYNSIGDERTCEVAASSFGLTYDKTQNDNPLAGVCVVKLSQPILTSSKVSVTATHGNLAIWLCQDGTSATSPNLAFTSSESGNNDSFNYLWVIIPIVVVVLVAALGGFFYFRSKEETFDLTEVELENGDISRGKSTRFNPTVPRGSTLIGVPGDMGTVQNAC